ncbi:PRMT5-domain-containing protein [Jaminaea rosea]|uniref:PRMT5-domain-containing protein n=1 Tax=Jaminaea rosea TaxID=1569628 RepID=A0A316UZ27_9BASI|nr:PRMT5-domain-containing protein [Jaminaea rosea]PWN29173.1 PRMT5-domain-containing protein [Jaminaea rosea]
MADPEQNAPLPVGHQSAAPQSVIAQHVSNQVLAQIALQQQTAAAAASRKAASTPSAPPSSKLPTLVEASHVNALNEATGPSPTGLPSNMDSALNAALAGMSAPQRALAQARSAGYGQAIIELANDEFRQRWERLCLSPLEEDDQQQQPGASSSQGYPTPSMMPSGAAVPPEAGGRPFSRSSSRLGIAAEANGSTQGSTGPWSEKLRKRVLQIREAEEWRKAPIFRRTELNLTNLDDSDGIMALAPSWLELDSPDEGIRLDSEIALHALITYASYLSISTFILPPPSSDPSRRHLLPHYARAISAALHSGPGREGAPSAGSWMTLVVRLPISSPHSLAQILASRSAGSVASSSAGGPSGSGTGAGGAGSNSLRASDDWAFEAWSQIRHLCGYHTRLQLLLDLSMPLPSSAGLSRWKAEPVSHIWLPASSYLSNAKGFPVLSKATQSLIRNLLTKSPKPVIVLSGTHDPPPQHTRGGPQAYLEYLRHLERTAPPEDAVAIFARGYADWLQAPLQPLMDNLEGATYEVFERDPVKYALYQEAVKQALLARPAGQITLIWVCGAGRGPLVSRCLAAAAQAGRAVKIIALEKNPSALITLQEKQVKEWGTDRVELRFGDMRTADRPMREDERADILVSELLGSFGDNELSPECLDGGVRFLKKGGISIPASYTSYVTPLSSAKLHAEVLGGGSGTNPCASTPAQVKAAETPFVVLFGSVDLPAIPSSSAQREKIQECWTFAHAPLDGIDVPLDSSGLPLSNSHNVRTSSHTFSMPPQASLIHGLAGYFEAHLYGDVHLSIHPDPARGSRDMLSWFPIFFPLKEPLYVPADGEVDVHLWRLTKGRRVWYEWSCEVFLNLPPTPGQGSAAAGAGGTGNKRASAIQFSEPGRESPLLGAGDPGAFANAPHTPRMPSIALPADGPGGGGGSVDRATFNGSAQGRNTPTPSAGAAAAKARRIKVGMSSLANPSGRSSWVGM